MATHNKVFAIRNHQVVAEIDVMPFSEAALDRLCEENRYDEWIYLSPQSAFALLGVKEVFAQED